MTNLSVSVSLASSCISGLKTSLKSLTIPAPLLAIGDRARQLLHLLTLLPSQPPQLLLPSSQRSRVPALTLIVRDASNEFLSLSSCRFASGLLIKRALTY